MTVNIQDIYLLCFAVGALWSLAALLLGGIHLGHLGHGHTGHTGHTGHIGHWHAAQAGPVQANHAASGRAEGFKNGAAPFGYLVNPSCAAVFLAWFGGVGYLLARHTGVGFWVGLGIAVVLGLLGASILAWFLRFLTSSEKPLDPADYEMVGILGRISAPILAGGVGELIYVRDGIRRALPARSEDGHEVGRNEEVVVMRYEKGIAYVRAWNAVTR